MTSEPRIAPQDWMTAPATRAVVAALQAGGAEVRFVGGCVRDAVAGRPVKDVDLATPLQPEQVTALLEAAGIKAVPTGIEHGTVTAVADGKPFEITTLRVDVEPLGRHAKVAFTDDWQADAARRDFTINALSCDPDGRLHDPFGGIADLVAGRVRFVGEARRRIEEDHLRLLRLFRFQAHYGKTPIDPDGLEAATALAPLLAKLSGERIRGELFKLLDAPDPSDLVAEMIDRQILATVLPEIANGAALKALLPLEPAPDPLRRMAALLPPDPTLVAPIAERLKLSKAESARLATLLEPPDDWHDLRALRRHIHALGAAAVADQLRLDQARKVAAGGDANPARFRAALQEAEAWQPKVFPLKGRDALALGVVDGPAVGRLLREVEAWWIAEDFAPDRAACLVRLKEVAGASA